MNLDYKAIGARVKNFRIRPQSPPGTCNNLRKKCRLRFRAIPQVLMDCLVGRIRLLLLCAGIAKQQLIRRCIKCHGQINQNLHTQFFLARFNIAHIRHGNIHTLREGGCLADIIPTMIEMMGMEQPAEMTGKSLLIKK